MCIQGNIVISCGYFRSFSLLLHFLTCFVHVNKSRFSSCKLCATYLHTHIHTPATVDKKVLPGVHPLFYTSGLVHRRMRHILVRGPFWACETESQCGHKQCSQRALAYCLGCPLRIWLHGTQRSFLGCLLGTSVVLDVRVWVGTRFLFSSLLHIACERETEMYCKKLCCLGCWLWIWLSGCTPGGTYLSAASSEHALIVLTQTHTSSCQNTRKDWHRMRMSMDMGHIDALLDVGREFGWMRQIGDHFLVHGHLTTKCGCVFENFHL